MESLILCDSSVQQNTGSTNKSLTYQGQETITVLQKEYKLSWTKWIYLKKQNTHKYNSIATAYIQNLKAHQDPKVFSAVIWCSEFGT